MLPYPSKVRRAVLQDERTRTLEDLERQLEAVRRARRWGIDVSWRENQGARIEERADS